MRLEHIDRSDETLELEAFSNWIANIGDRTIGGANDGHANIRIPKDILIQHSGDPLAAIVHNTYPSYSIDFADTSYLQGRAILAPTLEVVEYVNQYMNSLNNIEVKSYRNSDSTCKAISDSDLFRQLYTPNFLNSIRYYGVPNPEIILKIGTSVILLRNIDHSNGLCNVTRLMITNLGSHVVEAKILMRDHADEKALIPRMSVTPSDTRLPFKFQRR